MKKFISTLRPVYEILLYLESDPEYERLCQEMEKELTSALIPLNEDCPEYIRMTTELVLQEHAGSTILEGLMAKGLHLGLFEVMRVDGPFRFQLVKAYLGVKEKGGDAGKY